MAKRMQIIPKSIIKLQFGSKVETKSANQIFLRHFGIGSREPSDFYVFSVIIVAKYTRAGWIKIALEIIL